MTATPPTCGALREELASCAGARARPGGLGALRLLAARLATQGASTSRARAGWPAASGCRAAPWQRLPTRPWIQGCCEQTSCPIEAR